MFLNDPAGSGPLTDRASPTVIRFGAVEVRPVERQVRVDGEPVPLQGRAFDLLLALIDRQARVVSRAELYDAVWGDRVVEDGNLDVQVHTIRKLLGKHAVVTIPGRGYRFALGASAAPVDSVAPPAGCIAPPLPPVALFGREDDIAAIDVLLESHRLVSILGPGGIGKTAVALSIAEQRRGSHDDGVAWVDASPLTDEVLLVQAVARAAGLVAAGGTSSIPALALGLRPKNVLLVIDNAEHLVDTVSRLVGGVLERAPGVRILVTSQATLRVAGERVFRLAPLAVPDGAGSTHEARAFGAIALFVEEARAADHNFELDEKNVDAVVSLCGRLEGLPLAIKLAAARVPVFGIRGLEARLTKRLASIGRGPRNVPHRQQTLRAALDWSHSLLSDDEKTVFRRLAGFVGSFDLESATAVTVDDTFDAERVIDALAGLVDRSLVVASTSDPVRYRLLESAREYALERLSASPDAATIPRRHARAAVDKVNRLHERSWHTAEDRLLPAFADDLDDIRSALAWAIGNEPGIAVDLLGGAFHFLTMLGRLHEVARFCARVDEVADNDGFTARAARYWLWRAQYCGGVNHHAMYRFGSKAVESYRRLGDRQGFVFALSVALGSGRMADAERQAAAGTLMSVLREDVPSKLKTFVAMNIGAHEHLRRRYPEAAVHFEQAAVHAGASGMPIHASVGTALASMARFASGDIRQPLQRCRQAVRDECRRRYGVPGFPLGFAGLGEILLGRIPRARASFEALFSLCSVSALSHFNLFAEAFVLFAAREQRWNAAACLLGYAEQATTRIGVNVVEPGQIEAVRAALHRRLDAGTLDGLLAAGRQLTPQQVTELTLATEDRRDPQGVSRDPDGSPASAAPGTHPP